MQFKKINNRLFITTFFTIFIIVIKFYFLFIHKITEGSNLFVTSPFIFFNIKSFLIHPSSFQDWNHPGTPFYYFAYLLNLIFPGIPLSSYDNYLYLGHFFIVALYSVSIFFFIKIIENYLKVRTIFIFLLIFFSFFSFFQSLENIDPHSFNVPLLFFATAVVLRNLTAVYIRYNSLFATTFFLSLAVSIKLSFLPLMVSAYIAIIYKFIRDKKFILKNLLIFNILILFFILILNFPIIGRLPQILFNVLFSRGDTSFNVFEFFFITKSLAIFIFRENFLLFTMLLVIFYFTFKFFFKKLLFCYKKDFFKSILPIEIFAIFLFLSFFYTYFCVGSEIYHQTISIIRGINFRNADFYFIFLIPLLICFKELENFFNKKNILPLAFFIFFFSLCLFLINRIDYANSISNKNQIFYKKIYSNISKESKIAIYNNLYGYGFEDEHLFYKTINIMANDRFAEEVFAKFPNVRYLRLNDIMHQWKPEVLKNQQNKISKIKNIRNKWDNFLEKKLNKSLYTFLSYKSLLLTKNYFVGDQERNHDIFLKQKNEKIEFIIFPKKNNLFKQYNVSVDEFIYILGDKLNIDSVKMFGVQNDDWFILKIKQ